MLGEIHSLINDFPEYRDTITQRLTTDDAFAAKNKHYNQLDKEIRVLELNNNPIDDDEMSKLKQQRAELKDELYHQLQITL